MVTTKYLSMAGTFSKACEAFGFDKDTYVMGSGLDYPTSRIIVNGKDDEVLDWISGLGSNLFGYNNPAFVEHLCDTVELGSAFSLVSSLEYSVAEKLAQKVASRVIGWDPDITQVRFMKTGTEATSAAVRLARAITGRDIIITQGYHGYAVEFIAAEPPAHGIPQNYKRDIYKFKFGDEYGLRQAVQYARGNVAAIIVEQGVDDPGDFYEFIRGICNQHGCLFILDEIVTGLRYGMGGVAEKYGAMPDLICMGKALGNGVPISAVLGWKKYMSWFNRTDPAFCSSTFWGESLGLAAASWVLDNWSDEKIEYIENIGKRLKDGLNDVGWETIGHPVRTVVVHKNECERAYFIHRMFVNDILMNRPNFANMAHSELDVDITVECAKYIRQQVDKMSPDELRQEVDGKIPRVLFQRR